MTSMSLLCPLTGLPLTKPDLAIGDQHEQKADRSFGPHDSGNKKQKQHFLGGGSRYRCRFKSIKPDFFDELRLAISGPSGTTSTGPSLLNT